MAVELLTMVVRLRDHISRPLKGVRGEIAATTAAMNGMGAASSFSRMGRDIDGVNMRLRKMHTNLMGVSRQMTSVVGGFAKVGLFGGGAAMAGLGSYGFKTAGEFEQLRFQLKAFTDSQAESDRFMDAMVEFDKRSPFELLDVSAMGTSLLRTNKMKVDDIMPFLEPFMNVASGLGLGGDVLRRVSINMEQIASKGYADQRDIREFQTARINLPEIMKAAGYGAYDAKDPNSRYTFEDIVAAFQSKDNAEVARFAGLTEAYGNTMVGQMSKFRGEMSFETDKIMQGVFASLTEGGTIETMTENATSALKVVLPIVGNFMMLMNDLMQAALPVLLPLLEIVMEGLDTIVRGMLPVFEEMLKLAPEFETAFEELMEAFIILAPVLADLLLAVIGILPEFITQFAALIPALIPFLEILTSILENEFVIKIIGLVLAGLLGYKALGPVIGVVLAMSAALLKLAGAQAAVAATGGVGIPGVGGKGKKGDIPWGPVMVGGKSHSARLLSRFGPGAGAMIAGGIGTKLFANGMGDNTGFGDSASDIAGMAASGAALGAGLGSIIPGAGTLAGAAVGATVGGGLGIAGDLMNGSGAADGNADRKKRLMMAGIEFTKMGLLTPDQMVAQNGTIPQGYYDGVDKGLLTEYLALSDVGYSGGKHGGVDNWLTKEGAGLPLTDYSSGVGIPIKYQNAGAASSSLVIQEGALVANGINDPEEMMTAFETMIAQYGYERVERN